MIKVAVIGSGQALTAHVNTWLNIPNVQIAGVVHVENEQKAEVSKDLLTNIQDLWAMKPDVVDVCTTVSDREIYIKEAANHAAHVICDVPFADSVEETNNVIQLCNENNVYLLPGNTLHFSPAYANALSDMKQHAIGKPGVIRMAHQKTKPVEKMDIFTALGVYEFAFVLEAFGPVKRVMAKYIQRSSVEYAVINLRMDDGAIAHIELSWTGQHPESSFELTGDKGMITYDSTASNPIQISSRSTEDTPAERLSGKPLIQRQMEHYVTCLLKDEKPEMTSEHILHAMQIIEAAKKSVETGAPVLIKRGDNS